MFPVLYQCSFFTVYTYGVFVALSFLVCAGLLTAEAKRRGGDENVVYNLCFVFLSSGIIAARLLYVVLNWNDFKVDLWEIVKLQHGGLVWFGGWAGAVGGGLLYMKRKKLDMIATLDLFAPYTALAQSIGRIGCFFNGCCYGKESSWGVFFPVHGRILWPVQLLDAFSLLVIFIILRAAQKRPQKGRTFVFYLILAALQRFLMEFIRADARPFYFGLSIFQWMSVFLFTAGILGILFLSWKKKRV
jgi:phosphatidylglycerol:prolipoprotein diacylglycerol transferase